MPPKPLTKAKQAQLRRRFRLLVDESFDGNITLAARVLKMPVSTVHQYYQQGPRRFGAAAVRRIESQISVPTEWILGESGRDDEIPYATGPYTADVLSGLGDKEYVNVQLPSAVIWRIDRVLYELQMEPLKLDPGKASAAFFEPLLVAIRSGLLPETVLIPSSGESMVGRDLARMTSRQRCRVIHRLCDYWEAIFAEGEAW